MAVYLVTGGAGFIGSHIVTTLVDRGETVRVLDNLLTGNLRNLRHVEHDITMIQGDLRSPDQVREAVRGVEYLLHQAALPSVPRSVRDPVATNECNVVGTLNLLVAARDAGVRRVVVASSSSVYGDSEALPKVETMAVSPLSPYAVSKLATEQYGIAFWRSFRLETIALRYFNVFGPRQDPHSQYAAVIPRFIDLMRRGERPTIYGDGEQSRDFTYVDNVVSANVLACAAPQEAVGQVFNCACNERVSLNRLTATINELLGTSIAPERAEPRVGEVRHSLADIGKARRVLGYEVVVPFREGLVRLVQATA